MSVFSPVKAIILAYTKNDMPSELKKATVEVLDALDNDLDTASYIPSSTAEDAFDKFNAVLKGYDSVGEDVEVDDEPEGELFGEVEEDEEEDDDVDFGDDNESEES